MNYFNTKTFLIILLTTLVSISLSASGQIDFGSWTKDLENTLKSGDTSAIKQFFSDDFGAEELKSWKYQLNRGYLNFNENRVISLDHDAILIYIPTNDLPYDGDNHDMYFDFIYRIYKIREAKGKYSISDRVMDQYAIDCKDYILNIEVDTGDHSFLFDCNILMDAKSPHLFLKLAKDFEVYSFRLNGKTAHYDRFGYFLHCISDTTGIQQIAVSGKLRSPGSNNQFISMDDRSFFIRLGGFAAVPSPPPGNSGRYHFSEDSTRFAFTWTYPKEYTLLQYGDSCRTSMLNGKKQTVAWLNSKWMDEIAFYAEKDWEEKDIVRGRTHIGFFYMKKDEKECLNIINEVDTLVQWINRHFNNYGSFRINFVVLNSFVKGGLLNDGHSIIAQNIEIISSSGSWVHEICHSAPQPAVYGNYLWIKEGFTNYLSYEYLLSHKGETAIWVDSKRKYLHYFDLYEEPLINIRSTSIPSYWAAYSKAVWVFRMLEDEIGESAFRNALFKLGTMGDTVLQDSWSFLEVFEHVSGQNLIGFEEQWLYRRKNPVLTVQGQLENNGKNSQVKIRITQKEPWFSLPLEVEIKTEKEVYRKTIQVREEETQFAMPVKGKEVSINYDPESRLFALIKTNKKSFTDSFTLPLDTAVYKSNEDERKLSVWFKSTNKGITLYSKDDFRESVLELTGMLSPLTYMVNGDTIFIQDPDKKTLQFKEKIYDIAEPIYPKEFVPFLFAIADWGEADKKSMLYLNPGSLRCQVINAESERISGTSTDISLREFLSDDEIKIMSKEGYPVSFRFVDGRLLERE